MKPEGLEQLTPRITSLQDVWLEQEIPLEVARAGFLRRVATQQPSSLRHRVWAAAAILLLVGLGLGSAAFWPAAPLSVIVRDAPVGADAWVSSGRRERLPMAFSDGSIVTLEPGSRLRIAELRPDGATLGVESGAVDVSVVHRPNTSFRLTFGPFAVRVTGTRFAVNWRPEDDTFRITLREGSVVVSGCALGESRALRAGEVLSASCQAGRFEISRGQQVPPELTHAGPRDSVPEPALSADLSPAPTRARRIARPLDEESWQLAARAGHFSKALAAVEAAGFAAEVERASAEDLALLGDVARFGGSSQRSLEALSALRRRFPNSGRAGAAAFSIARIHFDQRAAYAEAAKWFRIYMREQPRGSLAREAQGRLMEALERSGDRGAARQVAEQYLAAHPTGPHVRFARSLLGH
ncbi:MAG TPA: FecR domain-containing protein [Polyangiaceae bacterium]|nr:FecR domain-containing protein [Polyangiaceae bacterium]